MTKHVMPQTIAQACGIYHDVRKTPSDMKGFVMISNRTCRKFEDVSKKQDLLIPVLKSSKVDIDENVIPFLEDFMNGNDMNRWMK